MKRNLEDGLGKDLTLKSDSQSASDTPSAPALYHPVLGYLFDDSVPLEKQRELIDKQNPPESSHFVNVQNSSTLPSNDHPSFSISLDQFPPSFKPPNDMSIGWNRASEQAGFRPPEQSDALRQMQSLNIEASNFASDDVDEFFATIEDQPLLGSELHPEFSEVWSKPEPSEGTTELPSIRTGATISTEAQVHPASWESELKRKLEGQGQAGALMTAIRMEALGRSMASSGQAMAASVDQTQQIIICPRGLGSPDTTPPSSGNGTHSKRRKRAPQVKDSAGWRWRKQGQKTRKQGGTRSYYRCTRKNNGCMATLIIDSEFVGLNSDGTSKFELNWVPKGDHNHLPNSTTHNRRRSMDPQRAGNTSIEEGGGSDESESDE